MRHVLFVTSFILASSFVFIPASPGSAQVAIGELSGPRRARSVRQQLASRLEQEGFTVVDVSDVEGDDAEAIAAQHGASAVVVGRVRRRGGRWRADLEVKDANGVVRGSVDASSRAVGGLAAQLARKLKSELEPIVAEGGGAAAAAVEEEDEEDEEEEASEPTPAASSDRVRIVVGDFSGRGAARVRNRMVRGLRSYDLVPREELDAAASNYSGDDAQASAAGELRVSALIEGRVSRSGRRWSATVSVTNASNGEEQSAVFRARTAGALATVIQREAEDKLSALIGATSPPPGPARAETSEDDGDSEDADEDGDPEDDDSEVYAQPRRPSDLPNALDIAVYGRAFYRRLSYNDDIYGALRGYKLQLGPAFKLAMTWYPGAHFTDSFGAHIGLEASYERAFGIDSVRKSDMAVFPTRSQDWLVGLRGRIPLDAHMFSLGLGYGQHYFIVENVEGSAGERTDQPEVPQVSYKFVRLHIDARLHVAAGFFVTLGAGYRIVLDQGGISDPIWFPKSDVGGVEVDLMLGYRLENGLEMRLGFDYRRYFYSMNVDINDEDFSWVAGGALDQYLGGSLGIAWRN